MKLSLWTQFSSNHSSRYTVIGQFATAEQAHEVKAELEALLLDIAAWWEQFDTQEGSRLYEEEYYMKDRLTPPEIAIKKKYCLRSFIRALDWCYDASMVNLALHQINDLVILDTPHDTWNEPYPFIKFMKQKGGKVRFDGAFMAHNLYFAMTCDYQNEADAERIKQAMVYTVDEYNNSAFELPGFSKIYGIVEWQGTRLHLQKVEIYADFFGRYWPTFEQQLQSIFAFVEQYPCMLTYEFVHKARE